MDLEKNKQRIEIMAAEIEELKRNGGGGETVDAYTKEEADDKFAEKATTYTKTEVDEAIASAAGGGLPAFVDLPLYDLDPHFPEDKMEILEKHLPFTTENPPTSTCPVYLFIGIDGLSYIYKMFDEGGFVQILKINSNTRQITSTPEWFGSTIYDINSINYMKYMLKRPSDNVPSDQFLYLSAKDDLNDDKFTLSPKMALCYDESIAAKLTNCPTNKTFYMFNALYTQYPTQTIFENDNPNIFYRRSKINASTWTPWYKFEGTAVS